MFNFKSKGQKQTPEQRQQAYICQQPIGRTGHARIEAELLGKPHDVNEVESWRVFKIMSEFVGGFELLRRYELAATVFGSARCGLESKSYQEAYQLSYKLGKAGFAIITGGGGGVMGAANKGAYDAGADSVGLNIELPREQSANRFTNAAHTFHYFFTRKVMLAYASEVYIFFPGGYGTLDEFTELVTLVQTKKIKQIPIVLVDREYWLPLTTWFEKKLLGEYGAIDRGDLKLFDIVDSVDEAFSVIKKKVRF